jgi:PIN like domain
MGLAKLLIRDHARNDVVFPGHPLLPEVPRGSEDLEWMPIVGQMGWIVLTRDRRIRSRPAELATYREQGLRSVWIGGKHDHSPAELADMFTRHEIRLVRFATKLGAGPWALTMTSSGVRELRSRGL